MINKRTPHSPRPLTGKQQAFVTAYLANGFNATRAADTAGYKGTETALSVQGNTNLRIPRIEAEITRRSVALQERVEVTPAHIQGILSQTIVPRIGSDNPRQADVLLRATELLGRTIGAFVDRKEVLQAGRFEITIERVEPDKVDDAPA